MNQTLRRRRWNPEQPAVHVSGDPDCLCDVYQSEALARLEQALEDSRSGRDFRASADDLLAIVDGTLTIHDLCVREWLAAADGVSPRALEFVE